MESFSRLSALISLVEAGFTETSLTIAECKVVTATMNRLASSLFLLEKSEKVQQKEEEEEEESGEIHW